MLYKKSMGYILVSVGIIAIICGIIIISQHRDRPMPSPDGAEASQIDETYSQALPQSLPVSKEKGNVFEDFIINLLADYRFTLLERTQDAVSTAGVVAESSKNPDLHVRQKRDKSYIDYFIECKYRSHWDDDVITFEDWQISRYRKFQRENRRKVIIALGVGGTPDSPYTLRFVPIDSLKGNTVRKIDTKFAVAPNPSALADYMYDYFTSVFMKAESRKKA